MADKPKYPISFRPNDAAWAAIEKIIAANESDWSEFSQTDAIQKALIEYAKSLPDPQVKKKSKSISSPVRP